MDIAKLKELMTAKKQSMKRVERTVKIQPGKSRVRLLQGWRKGEEHVWYHDFGQHFIKDSTDQIQAVYLCTDATFGHDCPVCKAIQEAGRLITDDATQKTLSKAVAGKTVLVNALMLDSSEPNTPVILELKRGVFGQLMEILEENGPEAFFDLNEGHEIVITRDGKGLNTTYNAQMAIKKGSPIPAAALQRLNNLDEYVKQENEEGKRKAISAVSSVAGIGYTPATSATSTAPALSAPSAPIGAAVSAPPAAAGGSGADIALDAELDDLLAGGGELDLGE